MLFVRVTIFAKLTTKLNIVKKAKYLIFDRLERNCFEKQHSPRIGSLFGKEGNHGTLIGLFWTSLKITHKSEVLLLK